ncbi:MAG: hypothetical protein LC772_04790 [Chloroflexi bacterium]|nr:hypothetical protein [Chloroflexota bacterium]
MQPHGQPQAQPHLQPHSHPSPAQPVAAVQPQAQTPAPIPSAAAMPVAGMSYPPTWSPQPVQIYDPHFGPDFTGRAFHGLMVGLQKSKYALIMWTLTGLLFGVPIAVLGFPWAAGILFSLCSAAGWWCMIFAAIHCAADAGNGIRY